MNALTPKDKRELIKEFSPVPGFVLKLTRMQFEIIVDEATNIDISKSGSSNGARFKHLLDTCTDEQIANLLAALRDI